MHDALLLQRWNRQSAQESANETRCREKPSAYHGSYFNSQKKVWCGLRSQLIDEVQLQAFTTAQSKLPSKGLRFNGENIYIYKTFPPPTNSPFQIPLRSFPPETGSLGMLAIFRQINPKKTVNIGGREWHCGCRPYPRALMFIYMHIAGIKPISKYMWIVFKSKYIHSGLFVWKGIGSHLADTRQWAQEGLSTPPPISFPLQIPISEAKLRRQRRSDFCFVLFWGRANTK